MWNRNILGMANSPKWASLKKWGASDREMLYGAPYRHSGALRYSSEVSVPWMEKSP